MNRWQRWTSVLALNVAAAVTYGILHDQVTAHLCVDYFSIGHPQVFPTTDPFWLAIGWGIIATWWVGALLGIPLACAACLGPYPPADIRSIARLMGLLLASMGLAAAGAGFIGYFLASSGTIHFMGSLAQRVPAERHALFFTDAFAHLASYGSGLIGGTILCLHVWLQRRRQRTEWPAA